MAKEAGFPWSVLKKSPVVPQLTRTWNGWAAYWDLKPTCRLFVLLLTTLQDLHYLLSSGGTAACPAAVPWKWCVTDAKNLVTGH